MKNNNKIKEEDKKQPKHVGAKNWIRIVIICIEKLPFNMLKVTGEGDIICESKENNKIKRKKSSTNLFYLVLVVLFCFFFFNSLPEPNKCCARNSFHPFVHRNIYIFLSVVLCSLIGTFLRKF